MSIFKCIWKDIKTFQNIDSYLTIIVAISLATLNLLGYANSQLIAPLILTVLALLAFTSLRNRHRFDELLESLGHSANNFFLKNFPPDFQHNFATANEIWLLGVSLHRTITFNYELIEKKLREGNKFKVMLVHPEGPGIELAMSRNFPRQDVAPKSASIRNTLQLLCDLQKKAPELLEIRTIQNPLSYGVTATDPSSASGALYLEHYTFGISTESLPRYVVRASDGYWYDFIKREISTMWESGMAWECKTN